MSDLKCILLMPRWFAVLLLFFSSYTVIGQYNLDSLRDLYYSVTSQAIKAQIGSQIASGYYNTNPDSTVYYLEQASELYLSIGDTAFFLQNARSSRQVLIELMHWERLSLGLFRILPIVANQSSYEFDATITQVEHALNRLSSSERRMDVLRGVKDNFLIGDCMPCQLVSFDLLAKYHLNEGNVDSASFYLESATRMSEESQVKLLLPRIYQRSSVIYLLQEDTVGSKSLLIRALEVLDEQGKERGMAMILVELGQLLQAEDNESGAFAKADSAKLLASKNKELDALALAYRLEASLWDRKNDYQRAYRSFKAYSDLKDSLDATHPLERGNPQSFRERQELENARLSMLLEMSNAEIQEQRIWSLLLSVTLIISFFLTIRYLRTIKKSRWAYNELRESNKKILAKSRELELAQEEIIKSEKMAYLGRIFAGIGHELNTPIAAVKSNLQLIEDAQMQEIKKFNSLADSLTPPIWKVCIQLVVASYQSQLRPLSTMKQRQQKKDLMNFFAERKPSLEHDLVDFFDELKIYEDLQKFDILYDHPDALNFLELVSYISTRTRSIMTAMEALQRADKILFSLKTYSFKNLEDTKTSFDIVRNINTILTLHQNKLKEITVYKQFDEEVIIEGYPDELTQVWTNLISNAAYANGYSGNLWIRIRQFPEEVRVEFEDSGGGVDAKVKDQIFEPFETTKPEGEGSGLGLSISKKVIEKHKGQISVENTPSGALFRVTLPKKID